MLTCSEDGRSWHQLRKSVGRPRVQGRPIQYTERTGTLSKVASFTTQPHPGPSPQPSPGTCRPHCLALRTLSSWWCLSEKASLSEKLPTQPPGKDHPPLDGPGFLGFLSSYSQRGETILFSSNINFHSQRSIKHRPTWVSRNIDPETGLQDGMSSGKGWRKPISSPSTMEKYRASVSLTSYVQYLTCTQQGNGSRSKPGSAAPCEHMNVNEFPADGLHVPGGPPRTKSHNSRPRSSGGIHTDAVSSVYSESLGDSAF